MSAIPFEAALFDLDGTLLDSLYVWKRVDELFFISRGMTIPEDYGRAIAGMSYRESAEYTVRNYVPGEKWEDVAAEWMRLAKEEYACRVQLKPGSLEYLRMLRREGVKLAVTTAMPPELFVPCLENLGVLNLFDELCSTEHTGGRGKADGEVYLLAAEKLGVKPESCAVFEDVPAGIQGAKKAGMRAYCIRDDYSKKDFPVMEALADGMLDCISEMEKYHAFPKNRRCVVMTAYCEGNPEEAYQPEDGDFVLCADAGWKLAERLGATPALVIGDFDSSDAPQSGDIERHPVMKDDTDAMLCLKHGMKLGYDRFLFVGGFGGRLDHTLANLQMLHFAANHGVHAEICDGRCRATVVKNGTVSIPRRPGKISLFSLTDRCEGITTEGMLYSLTDGELTNAFPLGVSNEYTCDEAKVTVKSGTLLIVQTDD